MSKPWETLAVAETAEGRLELKKRGERDYLITIAGRVLMNSFANRSEIALAELACRALGNRTAPRVLMAGLGLGCTLKAALGALPPDATVTAAELNGDVADWCRGPLAELNGHAASDPRVTVEIADVASLIVEAATGIRKRFDAIILDLYEGPFEADGGRGEPFYGRTALELTRAALVPGGVFAVWSEDPDRAFEKRLQEAGFSFERHRPGKGGLKHMVYIASRRAHKQPGEKKQGWEKPRQGGRKKR